MGDLSKQSTDNPTFWEYIDYILFIIECVFIL
ncbi:hypothetical protein CCA_00276 [Chlamydia caviae GPIC]|uniref:Uncharacterized protein n=1 Tax=Chlamydia caviae (strain ATCC VR-813 / DSM 19441 / 03DC25 / GPIC) TaxID=227941 RepID=Q823X7_CHLCV|nr:hypothetical protein CCA_00276 [Chlamydia caviae GPIC]